MDRLSSCYFCGIALDEPLKDYPLVAGGGEPGAVVTLCPTCRRKLATVLDAVVEEHEVGLLELGESDRPGLSGGPDEVLEAVDGAGESADAGAGTGTDTDASTGAGGDQEADGLVDLGGVEEDDTGSESGTEVVTDAVDPDAPEEFDGAAVDGTGAAEPEPRPEPRPEPDPGLDGDAGAEIGPEPGSGAGADPGVDDVETVDGPDGEPASGSGDGGSDGGATTEATVSALEYNKVMRLLQNREFPVERGEIVAIAANAYELSEEECRAVIDLAVDRGLLVEEGGSLDRPE